MKTTCFDVFRACVNAITEDVLIHREGTSDKEFHFQNWCKDRLNECEIQFEASGRNTYPDFCMTDIDEGYEIKGLAYPGRERDFDANSNVPSGKHLGRRIFYIFGRYPKVTNTPDYPVLDLIVCHGDFLNADHNYIHENKHVDGFGTYGDIMIRDRKMYVPPTPYSLLDGVQDLATLVVPADYDAPDDFVCVGKFKRTETEGLVSGYEFNLITNEITPALIVNPEAGQVHSFKAWRLNSQQNDVVTLRN